MYTRDFAAQEIDVPEDGSLSADASLFFTVPDENQNEVLELVRSDQEGIFIRDHGQWMLLADEDNNPRVWDRIMVNVNHDVVPAFDKADESGKVTVDMFNDYILKEDSQ